MMTVKKKNQVFMEKFEKFGISILYLENNSLLDLVFFFLNYLWSKREDSYSYFGRRSFCYLVLRNECLTFGNLCGDKTVRRFDTIFCTKLLMALAFSVKYYIWFSVFLQGF